MLIFVGATNYQGNILFTGEGQGDNVAPALFLMNPVEPYNTTSKNRMTRISAKSLLLM